MSTKMVTDFGRFGHILCTTRWTQWNMSFIFQQVDQPAAIICQEFPLRRWDSRLSATEIRNKDEHRPHCAMFRGI